MQKPTHIIFDLDHTLWDFETNAQDTLRDLVKAYRPHIGSALQFDEFYQCYRKINEGLWRLYRNNRVDVAHLRNTRFVETFSHFGLPDADWIERFSEEYMAICPTKSRLLDKTLETLDYLKPNYHLHILTNGFTKTQDVKIQSSGLTPYFEHVVTADMAGAKKPDPHAFHFTLEKIGITAEEAVYVGDSYEADVLGAIGAGLPVVYYNPSGKGNPLSVREVKRLDELSRWF